MYSFHIQGSNFCPHCGADLELDDSLNINDEFSGCLNRQGVILEMEEGCELVIEDIDPEIACNCCQTLLSSRFDCQLEA